MDSLLGCFYQLFGLSFWLHPFTAEDPLVSKWSNAKFLQICSKEETILEKEITCIIIKKNSNYKNTQIKSKSMGLGIQV